MNVSQSQFRHAILDSDQPVPDGLMGPDGPAGKRFSVYRNNVVVSLTEALNTGFPATAKLLGSQNFEALAGMFLRATPPKSPLMMHYGDGFPDFLQGIEALAHLPYLADVARLELAQRHAYHAADTEALDATALSDHDPDILLGLRFEFAPSVHLLRSDWPQHAIWAFNMVADSPKPAPVAQDVLITRPELDPELLVLPSGAADFIAALMADQTLGSAYETALGDTPEFDLGATLALLLSGAAFTKIIHDKETP